MTWPRCRCGTMPRWLIAECFHLGAIDGLVDLRLTQWAHMRGFRGHFFSKSRRYSTTFGQIREERAEHMRAGVVSTGRLPGRSLASAPRVPASDDRLGGGAGV